MSATTNMPVFVKAPGVCAQVHALWKEAGAGELLPRNFAVQLAMEAGFNPATARTQYQVWFKRVTAQLKQEAGVQDAPVSADEQAPAEVPADEPAQAE